MNKNNIHEKKRVKMKFYFMHKCQIKYYKKEREHLYVDL